MTQVGLGVEAVQLGGLGHGVDDGGTLAAAHEPRFRACAVSATCLEPTCHTIFEEASPTFKRRFMYMSGYTDEDKFNAFCKTLTWAGHAEKIRVPYLCVAGEADELSPLEHAERLLQRLGNALEQLSERQQRIFILSRLHGQGYAEIAAELGVSASTVQKELKLIMTLCMTLLERLAPPT